MKKHWSNRKKHAHGQSVVLGGLLYVMQIGSSHGFPEMEYDYNNVPNCTFDGNHKCRIGRDIDVTGTDINGVLLLYKGSTQ